MTKTRTIDGVQVTFHMAPGSEAPAEMLIFLPQFGVLDMAEDVSHTMHNLYTLRGSRCATAICGRVTSARRSMCSATRPTL